MACIGFGRIYFSGKQGQAPGDFLMLFGPNGDEYSVKFIMSSKKAAPTVKLSADKTRLTEY